MNLILVFNMDCCH